MCTVCGCGPGETRIEGHDHHHRQEHEHEHIGPDGTVTRHTHHHHGQSHDHDIQPSRLIRVEQDILAKNDRFAAVNRQLFAASNTLTLNLMSSPGSGKTTLLVRTLTDLRESRPMAVIEGDQQTNFDAERIRATGVPAIQVNTGKGCHLDAQMVTQALGVQPAPRDGVLFIENVGNLVCPAGFDLGESKRVVVISVTEGEDKPLKYPDMFATADLMIVNKIDLLPHLSFDLPRLIEGVRQVKPGIEVIELSSTTGAGLDRWYDWLGAHQPSSPSVTA
jgi:hydrogenase nickel incorporation protein HypB